MCRTETGQLLAAVTPPDISSGPRAAVTSRMCSGAVSLKSTSPGSHTERNYARLHLPCILLDEVSLCDGWTEDSSVA